MDDLTPPILKAVREVRWMISSGKSMKDALQIYLDGTHDAFASFLRAQWARKRQGAKLDTPKSHYQKAFWNLVERGCAGQPTLEALNALEHEVEKAAQSELDAHLASLPFKVLLPLLLFQFPAYLILLLGPMLRELNRQMGAP